MGSGPEGEPKIIVDEDWKAKVERERAELEKSQTAPQAQPKAPEPREWRLPPASFATLVQSLATQAMAALIEVAAPPEQKSAEAREVPPSAHLELARHLIDTLSVLDDKTKGNLTTHETALLSSSLHELRMAFLDTETRVRKGARV